MPCNLRLFLSLREIGPIVPAAAPALWGLCPTEDALCIALTSSGCPSPLCSPFKPERPTQHFSRRELLTSSLSCKALTAWFPALHRPFPNFFHPIPKSAVSSKSALPYPQTCRTPKNVPPFPLPLPSISPLSRQNKTADSPFWTVRCHLMSALPIFPGRRQPSIFGASELNCRVRNGNGWTLTAINTD